MSAAVTTRLLVALAVGAVGGGLVAGQRGRSNVLAPQLLAGTTQQLTKAGMPLDLSRLHHEVDIVISDKYKIVYLDNVKAGSSTMRSALQNYLHTKWDCSHWRSHPEEIRNKSGPTCCTPADHGNDLKPSRFERTTSGCISDLHKDYLFIATVRHPVRKFESGVREAWAQTRRKPPEEQLRLLYPSADQMLAAQLNKWDTKGPYWRGGNGLKCTSVQCHNLFLNEHLQPSWFRFSGLTSNGQPPRLDVVLRLEHLVDDFKRAAKRFPQLAPMLPEIEKPPHRHRRPDPASMLSPQAIAQLCDARSFYAYSYSPIAEAAPYDCLHP